MQKGYRPDGWLGIIVGSRIFIDFTKLEFHQATTELKRNLNLILNKQPDTPAHTKTPHAARATPTRSASENASEIVGKLVSHKNTSPGSNNKPQTLDMAVDERAIAMTVDEVANWFTKAGIHKSLADNLTPCTGQVLHQLFEMLAYNPEFFYGSLKTSVSSLKDLMHLAHFCAELKNLFVLNNNSTS